ncbi:MAG: hypothetical protein SXU28_13415 [Pseudomonadota bacterium]|nr:hypothetical protein [Pseudomonadota bacterium]
MRVITDVIDSVANGVRIVVGTITLAIMVLILAITWGASTVASYMTEEMIVASSEAKQQYPKPQRDSARSQALVQEGWGYDDELQYSDSFDAEHDRRADSRRGRRGHSNDWGSGS